MDSLLKLLSLTEKKEVVKFAKTLSIHKRSFSQTLGSLVFHCTQSGYEHELHFSDVVPAHLRPPEGKRAIQIDSQGTLTPESRKWLGKASQIFKERRYLVGHFFYTSDLKVWHFFYFDQRDWQSENNHWREGAHIHFVNYLWGFDGQDVWERFVSKSEVPGKALHIRFIQPSPSTGMP